MELRIVEHTKQRDRLDRVGAAIRLIPAAASVGQPNRRQDPGAAAGVIPATYCQYRARR